MAARGHLAQDARHGAEVQTKREEDKDGMIAKKQTVNEGSEDELGRQARG